MTVEDMIDAVPRYLLENGDFFGIVDTSGVTLQLMRGNDNRVWMEVPSPDEQGSYGRHTTLESVPDMVTHLPSSFASLKSELTFQSWQRDPGAPKLFALRTDEIRPLAVGRGGCLATDMITVGDRGVGYMYREDADREMDSGWRFFSGHESQDYVDDPANTEVYDVNTIANYDPDVIPLLDAPPGSAFERNERGELVPVQPE